MDIKGKKILAFTWRDIKHPEAGGADIRLHELCKRLVREGCDVTFISSKFKNAKENDCIDGIKVIRKGSKYTFSIAAPYYYLSKLKDTNYGLILEDMNKVPLFTPLFVKNPVLACCSQLNKGIFFKELFFPFALVAFFMEQVLMPLFYRHTYFMSASKSTTRELVGLGIHQKNIFIVNDGLNHKNYTPLPLSKKKPEQLLVLSRLKKYKGIQHIIRAMPGVAKALPGAKLYVAGTGDYEAKLRSLAKRLKLEDIVHFLGYVAEKEKIKLLKESSLLINYSFKEGWGINVIEANACGTPVIASDVSGLRDSVIHNKTGLLVKPADEKALAQAITKLLGDASLMKNMSKNAQLHAKKYGWDSAYRMFKRGITRI